MKRIIDTWGIPNNHGTLSAAFDVPAGLSYPVWTGSDWVSKPDRYVERVMPTVASLTQALTDHLDATAQQRRYDNRITCMVRAGFVGPFQAEGIAFATWCDTCNAAAYMLLAEVEAGTRPMPTSNQALIDAMPLMVWPV